MSTKRLLPPAAWRALRSRVIPIVRRWSRPAGFLLVNLWLIYHLAAIVLAPWSVPPASRLIQNSWRAVGTYDQALFLNHGYHYFAPEPGNSTLLGYVLEMPDGSLQTGRIPNRQIHPRLLYHRHFMLTESLASDDWSPQVRDELVQAMASELCREHGARRVTLSRVSHELPSMEFVRAGGTLDDPEKYTEEPLGRFLYDDQTQTAQLESPAGLKAERDDTPPLANARSADTRPADTRPTSATGLAIPIEIVPAPDRAK
jgi:hypothetical protein